MKKRRANYINGIGIKEFLIIFSPFNHSLCPVPAARRPPPGVRCVRFFSSSIFVVVRLFAIISLRFLLYHLFELCTDNSSFAHMYYSKQHRIVHAFSITMEGILCTVHAFLMMVKSHFSQFFVRLFI